jgi:hypothetical protein
MTFEELLNVICYPVHNNFNKQTFDFLNSYFIDPKSDSQL